MIASSCSVLLGFDGGTKATCFSIGAYFDEDKGLDTGEDQSFFGTLRTLSLCVLPCDFGDCCEETVSGEADPVDVEGTRGLSCVGFL